jgi:hypothetical protein
MKLTQKLIIEASAVGFGLVVLWYLFSMLSEKVSKKDNLIASLFIVGASFHLIAEFTGMNQWYCKNGNACSV